MKVFPNKLILVGLAAIGAGSILIGQNDRNIGQAIAANVATQQAAEAEPAIDPTVLKDKAMQVMETYCVSCHGPKEQKGKVRLDALETIDPVDLQELFATTKEVVHFEEMPPAKAKQPSEEERKVLMQWLESQLSGEAAKALAEKLLRFEYGNVVKHEDLFSGEYADLPAYTADRRWLISEFIFNEKVNDLLNYHPTRRIYGKTYPVAGDSGIHWSPKSERGNAFRREITNPFKLPDIVGVRYSGHEAVTGGTLLTMLGNTKRIAGHMSSERIMSEHYPAMHALMATEFEHREILRNREKFLSTYTYMDHLLEDLYTKEHEKLLPKLVRLDIPYPGDPVIAKPGQSVRVSNLGFLPRLDMEDVNAIFLSIATYKAGPFKATEDLSKMTTNSKGEKRWAPYMDAERTEYDQIIAKAERDWFMAGVTAYRIQNRVTLMKQFWDQWDMNAIYGRVKGFVGKADYKPLSDAEMAIIGDTIKKHRQKGDTYQDIIDKCVADWTAGFAAEREAAGDVNDAKLAAMIDELYVKIYERQPTSAERLNDVALMKSYLAQLETQPAIEKLIESLILKNEFMYRFEFGVGEADEHGRRMMSPRDASYALAYALTDSSPDEALVKAVEEGRLSTREDYEREVRRMLDRRDRWTIIDEAVQSTGLNASVTNQPIRKLRFFREFFGYPKAMTVFKDDARFGVPGHSGTVTRLIDEADLLVEYILEKDEKVIEELLTTEEFYVYHNGDNAAMKAASDELRRLYDRFKDTDWKNFEPEDLTAHMDFLHTIFEFKKTRKKDEKSYLVTLRRVMPQIEQHFSQGQRSGMPYMKVNQGFWHGGPVLGRTGQQMRGHEVTSYWNIDWRTWDYPTQQPTKMPNRKGLLTHPAWLIAHSQNLESDPIHRGKWVQEKLLAGTIPDVPIEVDAVIPPDHELTLRERMEDRTGDAYCWRCHVKMDPLGFPFEEYDDFGRFRTQENLEHPDNLIKPAPSRSKLDELTFGVALPVYKTKPVNPRGTLEGTEDSTLDGPVEDAFELIDRLAESDKVRQSIIRHAFRYFMGRNETLSDSKTLIDAEKAYLDSNGSFDEVIVSLLTSDSFIYRKPNPKD
ncbi:MAG: DUF1588 domain-containing protein [Phycisphaeraceae bacterium]